MKIRFTNENYPIEIPSFNWDEFRVVKVFEDVVFGWYGKGSISGQHYIEVSREDYDKNKTIK